MSQRPIGPTDVKELLKSIRDLRVAVIGDFYLDIYIFVDSSGSELSAETSLPTQAVFEQRCSLGGAGNVATNLIALGCSEVHAFGVVGDDPFGTEMVRTFKNAGINSANVLVQNTNWHTATYTKVLETHGNSHHESNRIDYGNFNQLQPESSDWLITQLSKSLKGDSIDAVIINQQSRSGIHTKRLRHSLQELIHCHPKMLWVTDSRDFTTDFTDTVLKLDATKAKELVGFHPKSENNTVRRWQKPFFITRGDRGCLVCEATGVVELPGIVFHGDIDPVGAGDTFVSGITAALAVGRSPRLAAAFGNLIAGVTIKKLQQTGTATPLEVMELARKASYK